MAAEEVSQPEEEVGALLDAALGPGPSRVSPWSMRVASSGESSWSWGTVRPADDTPGVERPARENAAILLADPPEPRRTYFCITLFIVFSAEKLLTLIDGLGGIVWEADPETFQFSFVSREAEKILGYPAED